MSVLASTYWGQDRLEEAEALDKRVLDVRRRRHPMHPETLIAMHNMAATYTKQGKLAQAEVLMQETIMAMEKVFGEHHPHTQKSIDYLRVEIRRPSPTAGIISFRSVLTVLMFAWDILRATFYL
jgi:ATP/maltotriose-dependent transcriptional regulator MalT